jgi:ABC-type nickel/cobalt efflux system permease component RcnA
MPNSAVLAVALVVAATLLLAVVALFVLWRKAEDDRARLAAVELDHKQARYSLQRAHDALSDNLGRVQAERDLLLEHANGWEVAKTALEEANEVLRKDVDTMRVSLLESERRRLDVGSVIGRVIHEKNTWTQLYQSLRSTAANAQSRLWGEIAHQAKLLSRPVSADVAKVAKAAEVVYTQPLPRLPSDDDYRKAVALAHDGGGVQIPATVPPDAPKPGPDAA